jgi:glycosyltransferase
VKISIITVAYNSAETLADTLRSVAIQTHADVEHIVVDGASTDATLAIARSHGQAIATLISEPDSGIYDAMNKGIARATGELIGFLNADDMLAHQGVLAAIADAASASGADAVYGDLVYVDKTHVDRVIRRWRSGRFSRSGLKLGWMPPHPTLYVRSAQLARVGLFDSKLRIAADYDFILRYFSRPGVRAAYLPQVLVRMRAGGASNHSLKALLRKSQEDLRVLRRNRVGGIGTLICKILRKLPQFV